MKLSELKECYKTPTKEFHERVICTLNKLKNEKKHSEPKQIRNKK